MDKPMLPASCADCVFQRMVAAGSVPAHPPAKPRSYCRRHAISPGTDPYDLTFWPEVKPTDRCGSGATVGDGTGPGIIACETCIHWYQPDGHPVTPYTRRGLPVEWWANTGYCTRYAPSPNGDEARATFWRVTHATDGGCGDGDPVEVSE